MTTTSAIVSLAGVVAGSITARSVLAWRLQHVPEVLVRTNVAGRAVPAVLGEGLVAGGLVGVAGVGLAGWAGVDGARIDGTAVAVAVTLAIMFAAGRWDDRRGDERPRGFKGHLSSARSGRVTGGIVKLAAGAMAGAVAGAAVADGWAILEVAVLVALSANFVNLLDRAPGRAGKVSITVALGLAIFGAAAWTIGASATIGAAVACLWPDLRERAMLGDAGANPLGAVVGLGLAMSLTSSWRIVAIGVLASLNLASERWSYSAAIDRTPWLRSLDRLGRK